LAFQVTSTNHFVIAPGLRSVPTQATWPRGAEPLLLPLPVSQHQQWRSAIRRRPFKPTTSEIGRERPSRANPAHVAIEKHDISLYRLALCKLMDRMHSLTIPET